MGCLSLLMGFSGYTVEPNVVYLTYLPHAEGEKMPICMALLGDTKNCNVRDASHKWRSLCRTFFSILTSQAEWRWRRFSDKVKRETLKERSQMTLNAVVYYHNLPRTKVNVWLEPPASGKKLHDDNGVSDKQCEVGLMTRTCRVNGCSFHPTIYTQQLDIFWK